MQERDETIMDKEKRIYDLKKKNQELEKFKFVLDYKILELKKQVEPRERDIFKLSDQIKAMHEELSGYQHSHDLLDTKIQDLVMKLKAAEGEVEVEASKEKQMRYVYNKVQLDVFGLYQLINSPNDLKVIYAESKMEGEINTNSFLPIFFSAN